VTHDYNGAGRPAGPGYDIGAFEYGATVPAGGAGGAGTTGTGGAGTGGSATGGAGGQSSGSGGGATAGGAAGAADSATSSGDKGGCGCRVGSRSTALPAWLLAFFLVLAGRRRRR